MGYLNVVGEFIYKQALLRSKLDALGENDDFLKSNGWDTGTKAVFFQASVPTGWTQDVSQNDRGLRVVSVLGGVSGGSQGIGNTITLAHAGHTISNEASHTHDITNHKHILDNAASNSSGSVAASRFSIDGSGFLRTRQVGSGEFIDVLANRLIQDDATIVTGAAGGHDHGGVVANSSLSDVSLAFIDVVLGTKDLSVGYTDLTNEFNSGDKMEFDPFPILDDNDDFNNARLTPFGSVMVFGQAAAPTGWTQLVTQNDKILRVVLVVFGNKILEALG